jgi:cell wall-associated NlpC family hydrolase
MPDEAAQRAAIVREARSWIGTRYENCADVKGRNGGVDCGMLLVRVFVDCGLCAPFDPRPYPPDWHLHRAEEKYLGFVFDRTREVYLAAPHPNPLPQAGEGVRPAIGAAATSPRPRQGSPQNSRANFVGCPSGEGGERSEPGEGQSIQLVQPGDVAVFRFGRCYSHGGIVVETDPLAIVHAYAPARCVVEELIGQNPELADTRRGARFFSYWTNARG